MQLYADVSWCDTVGVQKLLLSHLLLCCCRHQLLCWSGSPQRSQKAMKDACARYMTAAQKQLRSCKLPITSWTRHCQAKEVQMPSSCAIVCSCYYPKKLTLTHAKVLPWMPSVDWLYLFSAWLDALKCFCILLKWCVCCGTSLTFVE